MTPAYHRMNARRAMACRVLDAIARLRRASHHHPRLAAIAREAGLDEPIVAAELDRLVARGRVRRGCLDDRCYIDTLHVQREHAA